MSVVTATHPPNHEGTAGHVMALNQSHFTNVESQQEGAAAGGQTLNFNNELQRLLSYPDSFDFSLTSRLAKHGFYFLSNSARCHFCPEVINPVTSDLVVEPHNNCDKIGNIELRANTSDFRYEYNRILSFLRKNWPKQADGRIHVGALDLARWGFYYTGEADAARCNFCRLEVRGWERGDTAESEHRRWNPHCPFLSGRAVGNIRLGDENSVENVQSDDVGQICNISTSGSKPSNLDLGILTHSPPKHPEYASLSSRLNSYVSWPLSLAQRPQQLAEAGFYYTGKGDRVICYQCGGGLKDWGRTDQPWVEHAVWFPRCSYLNLQKGMHFIQHVQHLKQQADTPFPSNISAVSSASSVSSDSGISSASSVSSDSAAAVPPVTSASSVSSDSAAAVPPVTSASSVSSDSAAAAPPVTSASSVSSDSAAAVPPVTSASSVSSDSAAAAPPVTSASSVSSDSAAAAPPVTSASSVSSDSAAAVPPVTSASSVSSDSAAAAPPVKPEPPLFSAPASAVSQNREVPVERQCKICLEKELGIVFLPCGHMAACVDCAPQLNNCPLCRGHLSAYIRAFLP